MIATGIYSPLEKAVHWQLGTKIPLVARWLWTDYKCHPGYLPCPAPLRQAFSVIMSDCLPILTDFISHVYLGGTPNTPLSCPATPDSS